MFIAILAAGSSRRMRGADKLLETVGGLPLLAHLAGVAHETGLPVVVALPPKNHAPARHAALADSGARLIEVPDHAQGMAASLRKMAQSAPAQASAMLVMLGDMPEIDAADLRHVIAAANKAPGSVIRASTADGRAGHPVIFPARLWPDLVRLQGDQGARDMLKSEAVQLCPLPGQHALTDLDTPEAWAAWRAAGNT